MLKCEKSRFYLRRWLVHPTINVWKFCTIWSLSGGRLPEIKVLFSLPYKEYIRMLRNICEDWEILQKKTLQQQANKHYSRWFLLFEIKIILPEDVKNLIECCMSFSDLVHEINIYIYSNWSVKSLKVYAMWGWGTQE